MTLSREQIKGKSRKVVDKEIPALGGKVKCREISADNRAEIADMFSAAKNTRDQQLSIARLIVLTVVDDSLNPLYDDAAELVNEVSSEAFDQLGQAAFEVSGLASGEKEKARKKSKPRRKNDSPSSSA